MITRSLQGQSSRARPLWYLPLIALTLFIVTMCLTWCLGQTRSGASTPGFVWGAPTQLNNPTNLGNAISCSSPSLCVVATSQNDEMTFNGSTWTTAPPPLGLGNPSGVSCPTSAFCALASEKASVFNGTSWSPPTLVDAQPVFSLSCATPTFCVGADLNSRSLVFNGSSWSAPTAMGIPGDLARVSCASPGQCVAVTDAGKALTGNGVTWTPPVTIDSGHELTGISCPTTALCVAVDAIGRVFNNGTLGTWGPPVAIDPGQRLTSISCPTPTDCVAVDAIGRVLVETNGVWGAPTVIDAGHNLNGVSCPTTSFCAVLNDVNQVILGVVPPPPPIVTTTTPPPVITSLAGATFTIGRPNSFTVTASGTPPPSISESGSLPTGVAFDAATGTLAGDPAAGTQGNYPITLSATSGSSPPTSQNFVLTVVPAPVSVRPIAKIHHPSSRHRAILVTSTPPSGPPGSSVTLRDPSVTASCRPIYIFFDNQLITQTRPRGHRLDDQDILIPGDASPGVHHLELSCTQEDPWIGSSRFIVTATEDHAMGFITSLPQAGHLVGGVKEAMAAVAVGAGLLGLIVVYLLGFPAEWFNDTYDANKERLREGFRRRFPSFAASEHRARSRGVRLLIGAGMFTVFVAVAGLINSFLDPSFGWDRASLWLFLGQCGGVAVITLCFQIPALVRGARRRHPMSFEVLIGSILIAAVCVAISRVLRLEPGYLYGLIAVFGFRPELDEKESGRLTAWAVGFVLVLSVAAWFAWIPVSSAVSHGNDHPGMLVLQAILGVTFILGIESVAFGMIPLPFLPGREVASWNRWIWAILFGLGLVGFVEIMLQPGSGFSHQIHHLDLLPILITFFAFFVVTIVFMGYFKLRKPKEGTQEDRTDDVTNVQSAAP